jgi:meso-butanediol dehydrogenase/(S,S)-butanediol dehydrogenase/diacetyl reductase
MNDSNTGRFDGRVAIVTGGASGIGEAIVRRLIDEGASVVVADINRPTVEAATESFGARAFGVHTDVTDEDDFEELIEAAVHEFGTLDAIFNVAGGSRPGSILDVPAGDWDFTLKLNLYSAFYGTRLAARQFIREEKRGSIVNIASLNATVPLHGGAGYSAAKAAVVMLSKQAALELGDHGIRVNAVSPGFIETPATSAINQFEEVKNAFLERIPMGRGGSAAEAAAAAVFLASDDASYISGSNLVVDAGWSTTGYPDLRRFQA